MGNSSGGPTAKTHSENDQSITAPVSHTSEK